MTHSASAEQEVDVTPIGSPTAGLGLAPCACEQHQISPSFVVLTGGPGAGKTAVLNIARQRFCRHVRVLEEAASIVFGGGFPRRTTNLGRHAAQRAIYYVQIELQRAFSEPGETCVALCDRGTMDGLAYWPGDEQSFFDELGTTRAEEFARYKAVIHLRTAPPEYYNRSNRLRVETAAEAGAIDERILVAWSGHPNRVVIGSQVDFFVKAQQVLGLVAAELPECCRHAPEANKSH